MKSAPKSILTWLVCLLLASQGAVRALHHHDADHRGQSSDGRVAHAHSCPYCSSGAESESGAEQDADSSRSEETPAEETHVCLLCQTLGMPAQLVGELTLPACECAFETLYSTHRPAAARALNTTWARGPPAAC